MNRFAFSLNRPKTASFLPFFMAISVTSNVYAVESVNTCRAVFSASSLVLASALVSPLLGRTETPNALSIRTTEGKIVNLAADNPYFDLSGQARDYTKPILSVIENRSAKEQSGIDESLTAGLADFGMGFKKKDGTPFDVKVNGLPASVPQAEFNKFVAGMEPVLVKMRRVLQVFMSNPNAAPEAYGLDHLSREQVKYIIDEMKNSPYFEPLSVDPSMKDYEFGSVYGVDATFGKLAEHLGHIFEINAGTPSGLSNTTMIFEVLRKKDPALFNAVIAHLSENNVFKTLRETMEAHGKKKIAEGGLSIEIGTGIYNGAHPDIAMISYFSGMPLAERGDLFIDVDGFVRLKNKVALVNGFYEFGGGARFKHAGRSEYEGYPQVSAIYSRSEEGNVLQENTSATRAGVGIKIPSLSDTNAELNKSLGLKLRAGVAYDYIEDASGKVVGVNKNPAGEPLVQTSWDQFAVDPVRAENTSRSLVTSIHKNRVYLSNFGTRLIDHKGILSLVTLQVKSELSARGLNPDTVVSPPRELRTAAERREFYKNPRDTVVKVPDESGGVGVYILPTETDANVASVVAKVRATPSRYVIQKLADFMGIVAPKPAAPDTYGLRAFDGRTFIFLGPDGKTRSDNWGILVRVADDGKLSTNTSQGAQYGWMQIYNKDAKSKFSPARETLPRSQVNVLVASQQFHLRDYLISMDMTADGFLAKADAAARKRYLQNFWSSARTMMSVLGPNYSKLIGSIEDMQSGKLSDAKFVSQVKALRAPPGERPRPHGRGEIRNRKIQLGSTRVICPL